MKSDPAPASPTAPAGAPPRLPDSLADNVGYLLAKAHLLAREIGNTKLAGLGLEVREFGALALIEDEGPLSQQEASELMKSDRTTMVAIVDHLESEGLVMRRRNPVDRRAYALEITPLGRRTLKRARELVLKAHEDLLSRLSGEERDQLRELLRRILTGG